LPVIGGDTPLLNGPLDRQDFAQQEQVWQVDIGIFSDDIWFGVMLEVTEVPPMGRSTLLMKIEVINYTFMEGFC
jgi:hypothetical protein